MPHRGERDHADRCFPEHQCLQKNGIVASLSLPSPLVRAPEALHMELLAHVRDAAAEVNAALRAAHR